MPAASRTPICPAPVIGIIGGIGSGKSAVARWVAERHPVAVIDADHIGHEVLQQPAIKDRLREAFGVEIFDADGGVIRSALGRKVFGPTAEHQAARRQLESIVHPAIRQVIEQQLQSIDPNRYTAVLLDAAILLETGWADVCQDIIFIDTPLDQRQQRVASRGWSAEELAKREASQWPLDRKRSAASFVLSNSGSLDDAGQALWEFLRSRCVV